MSKKINDPTQIEAVVFGYLIREFGKVQTSKFNKITNELGLDRVGVDRLKEISEMVEEHEGLKELVDGAIEGKYTLEDLVHIDTNKVTPYEDLDVYNVLSSYSPQHERVLEANRHFNRTQKNGSYLFNLMEDVKNDLKLEFRNSPKILEAVSKDKDFDAKLDKASLIVTLSDLHVGALNDVGYKFDYEILIKRLNKYKQEIERMVETIPGISNIRLYILGDSVEHFYMRNQQSFEAEFPYPYKLQKLHE